MLIQENLYIAEKWFTHTFSSIGNFIEDEQGVRYADAFDLADHPRIYIETDVNIEEWERQQEETQGEPE